MISRLFLPYVVNIGTPALRRKILDFLPLPAGKALARVSDTLHREAKKIVQGKKDALVKGDEAAQQLVSNGNGKDIMSVLCELCLMDSPKLDIDNILSVKANMQANDADKLPDSVVYGQVT